MESQPKRIGKLALCASSCMLAKETLVKQEGVGEDLPFTLFGWIGSSLAIVAQLDQSLMKYEPDDRLQRVSFCASLFRMGWGVDSITFMAEAYCSTDPSKTESKPLDMLFANGHEYVRECLTFTHIDSDDPYLVLLPYKIGLGRAVEWLQPIPQKEVSGLRDSAYPVALRKSLELNVQELPDNPKKYYDFLMLGLTQKGFNVDLMMDAEF